MLIEYIADKHICPNSKCNAIISILPDVYDSDETSFKCPVCGKTAPLLSYKRKKTVHKDKMLYTFMDKGDGRAVASVTNEHHIDFFLNLPHMFRVADPQTIKIPEHGINILRTKYNATILNGLSAEEVKNIALGEFKMSLEPGTTKKQATDYILEMQKKGIKNVQDAEQSADTIS